MEAADPDFEEAEAPPLHRIHEYAISKETRPSYLQIKTCSLEKHQACSVRRLNR